MPRVCHLSVGMVHTKTKSLSRARPTHAALCMHTHTLTHARTHSHIQAHTHSVQALRGAEEQLLFDRLDGEAGLVLPCGGLEAHEHRVVAVSAILARVRRGRGQITNITHTRAWQAGRQACGNSITGPEDMHAQQPLAFSPKVKAQTNASQAHLPPRLGDRQPLAGPSQEHHKGGHVIVTGPPLPPRGGRLQLLHRDPQLPRAHLEGCAYQPVGFAWMLVYSLRVEGGMLLMQF
jgi:hypothetical protein